MELNEQLSQALKQRHTTPTPQLDHTVQERIEEWKRDQMNTRQIVFGLSVVILLVTVNTVAVLAFNHTNAKPLELPAYATTNNQLYYE